MNSVPGEPAIIIQRVALEDLWATNKRQAEEIERLQAAFANSEVACLIQIQMVRAESERLQAALKIHHDLELWSLGHEVCPECHEPLGNHSGA